MSWNEVGSNQTEAKKAKFLSFPQGITNIRVLDSEPYSRWQHWIPSAKRSVTCIGKGCPICEVVKNAKANGETPAFNSRKTHSLNVINRTTGEVEVIEQGNGFFEELRELLIEEGDIRNYDIKVKKTGTGLNTKYRLTAGDKSEVNQTEYADQIIDLEEYFSPPTKEQVTRLMNGEDPKEVFSKQESESEEVELS